MAVVEQEKVLLQWKGASRPFKRINLEGMMVPGVIVILVGVVLLVAGEWMLLLVVAALGFAFYMWSTVPPEQTDYVLTNWGLRLGGRLFEFGVMQRWWKEEKMGSDFVVVETFAVPMGRLFLPVPKETEKKVTEILEKYVVMDKPIPTTVDKMGKWLSEKFPIETGK